MNKIVASLEGWGNNYTNKASCWLPNSHPECLFTSSLSISHFPASVNLRPHHYVRNTNPKIKSHVNEGNVVYGVALLMLMSRLTPTYSHNVNTSHKIDSINEKSLTIQFVHSSVRVVNMSRWIFRAVS
jgi:hypothetical protein